MTAIRIIIHIPSQGRMLANANRKERKKERKSEKPPATKNKDTQILATRKNLKMSPEQILCSKEHPPPKTKTN
jgi:hypothetical protein